MIFPRGRATVAVLVIGLLAGCGTPPQPPASPTSSPTASRTPGAAPSSDEQTTAADGEETCEYVETGEAAKEVQPPKSTEIATSGTVGYLLRTSEGDVKITLDRVNAPCTANSFESLAQQGYFDQTRCHRLVDSGIFVLQCGDPTGTGTGGPGYTFADEVDGSEQYKAGVVAMANSGPNSNGSQFFLVYGDSFELEPKYTIFATMDEPSRQVVARISIDGQDGQNPAGGGRPNNPAEISSVAKN